MEETITSGEMAATEKNFFFLYAAGKHTTVAIFKDGTRQYHNPPLQRFNITASVCTLRSGALLRSKTNTN